MKKLNTKVLKSSDEKRVGVKETLEVETKSIGPKPPKSPITPTPRPRYVTEERLQNFGQELRNEFQSGFVKLETRINININVLEQRMNNNMNAMEQRLTKLILNQSRK